MPRLFAYAMSFFVMALPHASLAKTIDFNLTGQLSDNGLAINDVWDFATFSGSFTVDFDQVKTNLSTNITYQVTAMDLTLTSTTGATLDFEGPNEFLSGGSTIDESDSFLGVFKQAAGTFDQGLSLTFYELYPSDLTGVGYNRRFLNVTFDANSLIPFVDGFDALKAADPLYGDASRFDSGFLQFGGGQAATFVSSAQLTEAQIAAVPVPASMVLVLGGLGALAGAARRGRVRR